MVSVRESIYIFQFYIFSEMSLEDCCISVHPDEEAENSETWYTSFYNTALYGDAQRQEKLRLIIEPI